MAGVVASARSLAGSIDRMAASPKASGHGLSMMHAQLLEALKALSPDTDDAEAAWGAFLEGLNASGRPASTPTP